MSLLQLQESLAKLLTNKPLRDRFFKLGQIGDDLEETDTAGPETFNWEQLRHIQSDRLELYADLLYHKRLGKIQEVLSRTWFLLEPDLTSITKAYCDENPPTTISKLEEARLFYDFLGQRASSVQPPYVKNVALYELVLASFTQKKYAPRKPKTEIRLNKVTTKLAARLTCIKNEGAEVVRFDYDLEEIFPFLERNERPPDLAPSETLILFYGVPGEMVPRSFRVNEQTQRLLELCDGRRSIARLIRDLGANYKIDSEPARDQFRFDCLETLNRLSSIGIVEVRYKR